MENAFFSFTPFDFGIQGGLSPPQLEDYEKEETVMFSVGKGEHLFGVQDELGEMNTNSFEHGFYQDTKSKKGVVLSHMSKDQYQQHHDLDQQQQSKLNFPIVDDFNFETLSSQDGFYHANKAGSDQQHYHYQQQQQHSNSSPSNLENFSFDFSFPSSQAEKATQSSEDSNQFAHSQVGETNKKMPPPQSSQATLELLSSYGSAFKNLKGDRQSSSMIVKGNQMDQRGSYYIDDGKQKLSTEEIMRVAGARYVQFSSQGYDDLYSPMHPFGYALSGLCKEETEDVELAHVLLSAAEKVSHQQFERASRLLHQCERNANLQGTPVQRVVHYFSEVLREKIEKEAGFSTSKGSEEASHHHVQGLGTNMAYIACHQEVPFHRVMQFVAVQAIIENVANERRIHLIDLEIRSGVQWTGLMESLAEREECRVELLTITAVGVRGKQNVNDTGERLATVAKSLNLPFQFKVVIVSDMADIKDQLFNEVEDDEALVVYAPLVLRTMIPRPRCLENLMKVMRNLNPSLMVVIEVEANHNSPSFVNRFIDALFYYSAFFDCLDSCMKQEKYRVMLEGLLREGIRNIVAAEGDERVTRSVRMDVWRAFFARFKMVETSFSSSSLYQASLVGKKFGCATLDRNGKCLTVGWRGTPIHSVSAWKFR